MKKVLYLIDTLEVGGAETSILEICLRLKNWEPIVVTVYEGDTLKKQFVSAGIKVIPLGIKAKFGFIKAAYKLSQVIEKVKPDIIHATLFRAEIISRMVARKFEIPLINSFVNDSYSKERVKMLNFRQKISFNAYKLIDRFTAGRVTKFMSITHSIISTNARALKIPPKDVEVIYRGRDIDEFSKRSDPVKIAKLREQYGDSIIILTVSRLLVRKGYIEAIEAINKVLKTNANVIYLIAGEGHDRYKFQQLIIKRNLQNNIFLLGNRNDIPSLMTLCNLFLFPSHYEGQGGALIEAMIMGKPIISSKIPVIEESVKDNFSAILYQPQNSEDLTQKIQWALQNPDKMKDMGKNAKIVALKRFNIAKISREHEELYDRVLLEH